MVPGASEAGQQWHGGASYKLGLEDHDEGSKERGSL